MRSRKRQNHPITQVASTRTDLGKEYAIMDPLLCGICISLALVLGLLGGFGAARLVDRSRLNSTRVQAREITEAAKREADNIIKSAELTSKEELLHNREGLEREAEEKRK